MLDGSYRWDRNIDQSFVSVRAKTQVIKLSPPNYCLSNRGKIRYRDVSFAIAQLWDPWWGQLIRKKLPRFEAYACG